jgi:hypothetical protein
VSKHPFRILKPGQACHTNKTHNIQYTVYTCKHEHHNNTRYMQVSQRWEGGKRELATKIK